jgi:hypothetical protein
MSDRLTTALFAGESCNACPVHTNGADTDTTSACEESATAAPSR